jgi:hypothetical protein
MTVVVDSTPYPNSRSLTPRTPSSTVSSTRSTPMASPRLRRSTPRKSPVPNSSNSTTPRLARKATVAMRPRTSPTTGTLADHRVSLRHIQPGTTSINYDNIDNNDNISDSARSLSPVSLPEVLTNLDDFSDNLRDGNRTPTNAQDFSPSHERMLMSPPASWGSETPSESDSGARSLVTVEDMDPRVPQKGTLRAMSRKKSMKKV